VIRFEISWDAMLGVGDGIASLAGWLGTAIDQPLLAMGSPRLGLEMRELVGSSALLITPRRAG